MIKKSLNHKHKERLHLPEDYQNKRRGCCGFRRKDKKNHRLRPKEDLTYKEAVREVPRYCFVRCVCHSWPYLPTCSFTHPLMEKLCYWVTVCQSQAGPLLGPVSVHKKYWKVLLETVRMAVGGDFSNTLHQNVLLPLKLVQILLSLFLKNTKFDHSTHPMPVVRTIRLKV